MTYQKLSDAVQSYPELSPTLDTGKTQVWFKRENAGALFNVSDPNPNNLNATHILLGAVKGTDPEELFYALQGEIWSPNGEAQGLISNKGLKHTSMSVGDVLVIEGEALRCESFGFRELKGPETEEGRYQVHIVREGKGGVNEHPDGCYFCGSSLHHSQECPERP